MLVDTSYLYFRAFHGFPDTLRTPDGRPNNAVRGILDFLTRLITDFQPDDVICAWDADWRPQWRVDLLDTYKTHRVAAEVPGGTAEEEAPDDLGVQVPWIREALTALGLPVIGVAEHEADDVIGTLATTASNGAMVVTGDRDLIQLVDDARGVEVIWVGGGMSKIERIDEAWVQNKYGVPANRYLDLAALRGDPSDGLPGVKGIGEKTAASLLARHGDLDGIRAAAADPASDLKPAQRTRIAESEDYLSRVMPVIQVVRDLSIDEPRTTPVDVDAFAELTGRLGLGSSAERILAALEGRNQ